MSSWHNTDARQLLYLDADSNVCPCLPIYPKVKEKCNVGRIVLQEAEVKDGYNFAQIIKLRH